MKTIKNVGSYKNMILPVEFSHLNFIFGENGSGKTIFSKLISLYSRFEDVSVKEDIKKNLFKTNAEISLKIDSSYKNITTQGFHTKDIYVFNSLFVSNYLYDGSNADAKKFNIDQSIQTQITTPLIEQLKAEKNEINAQLGKDNSEGLKKHIKGLNEEIASVESIVKKEFLEKNPITRIKLSTPSTKYKKTLRSETEINKEIENKIQRFKITNNENIGTDIGILNSGISKLENINFDLIFDSLNKCVEDNAKDYILNKVNEFRSKEIKFVDTWYSNGLALLKETKDEKCPLCHSNIGSTIEKLISDYQAYFNKEKDELEGSLKLYIKSIDNLINNVNNSNNANLFVMLEKYNGIASKHGTVALFSEKLELLEALNSIKAQIETKLLNLKEIGFSNGSILSLMKSYNTHISNINIIINNTIAELSNDSESQKIEDELKNLFYEKFSRLVEDKTKNDNPISTLNQLQTDQRNKENRIKQIDGLINTELANLQIESKYVNQFLKDMNIFRFNVSIDKEIKVEYPDGENSKSLKHSLSEGEKTTLAFAYFLSKIKSEVKAEELSKVVVYIDDPISSMDEDRLFHTAKVIYSEFSNAQQLFVSSHSYKFLKILINFMKHIKSKKVSAYIIRNSDLGSNIEVMPDTFANFTTLYYVKLHEILDFINGNIDFKQAIHTIPNDIRIVFESFFSFKFAYLKSNNKFMTPGLSDFIKKFEDDLSVGNNPFKDFREVDGINENNWHEKLNYMFVHYSNMFSHGNPSAIDSHTPLITESELKTLSELVISLIKFFDGIHFDSAQSNISVQI